VILGSLLHKEKMEVAFISETLIDIMTLARGDAKKRL
jgi:hypothetical protein